MGFENEEKKELSFFIFSVFLIVILQLQIFIFTNNAEKDNTCF